MVVAPPALTRFVAAAAAPEEYDMTPSGVSVEEAAAAIAEPTTPVSCSAAAQHHEDPYSRAADEAAAAAAAPPAEKRAKTNVTTVPCYRDVDISSWTTKVKGKNNFGSPTILIFGKDGVPSVALSHRDEARGFFPFKLDLEPANGAQIPSFLSGKPTEKMTEGLDMQISLLPSQIAFLESVDEWIQKEAVLNSKEWFGRTYSAVDIAAMYSPVLKKDKEERYPAKIKAKINLMGPPDFLTKVTYIPVGGGGHRTGAGWEFVKPLLGSNGWRGNEVRAVVDFRRVWIVGKKFGISVVYKYLIVMEKETKPTDVDFPELDYA